MNKFQLILGSGVIAAMASTMVPAQSLEDVFGEGYVKETPFGGLNKEEFLTLQAFYFDQADQNQDGILTHREKAILAAKSNHSIPADVRRDIVNDVRALRGEPPLPRLVEEKQRFKFIIINPKRPQDKWAPFGGQMAYHMGEPAKDG